MLEETKYLNATGLERVWSRVKQYIITELLNKQNVLMAGDNISIENDVIHAAEGINIVGTFQDLQYAIEEIGVAVNSPGGMTEIALYKVQDKKDEHYFL